VGILTKFCCRKVGYGPRTKRFFCGFWTIHDSLPLGDRVCTVFQPSQVNVGCNWGRPDLPWSIGTWQERLAYKRTHRQPQAHTESDREINRDKAVTSRSDISRLAGASGFSPVSSISMPSFTISFSKKPTNVRRLLEWLEPKHNWLGWLIQRKSCYNYYALVMNIML